MSLPLRTLVLVATFATASGFARAQPATDPPQVSTSNYADGTGDSAVGALNASQLNGAYRGPYYQVQRGTNQPLNGPPPPFQAPFPQAGGARTAPPVVAAPPPPPSPAVSTPAGGPSAIYPAGPPGTP